MTDETELDADLVTLRVDGYEFAGVGGKRWAAVEINTSINDLAGSFAVKALGVFADEEQFIKEGSEVEVWAGADKLLTGFVDEIERAGDAESLTVQVSGRSKTCDLVDCSAPLGTWSGLTLLALLRTLTAEYGTEIVDEIEVGSTVVRRHTTEEGESLFDAIDRLGRDHRFLATDDGRGRLVLTRAGAGGAAPEKIVRGTTGFLSGSVRRSQAERYSHIKILGQIASDLAVDPNAQGGAEDAGVLRFRELIVKPERGTSKGDAAKRAAWEATTRAAKALECEYEVRGWGTPGARWTKNQIVDVLDGFGRVGADLLTVRVRLSLDPESGRKAFISVAPPEAFTPAPGKTVDVRQYEQGEGPELTDPGFDGEEGDE